MKRLSTLCILVIVLTMNISAQDKTSDIKKLFTLLDIEKTTDGMVSGLIPMLKQQASEKIKGSDAKEKFDQHINFLMEETKNLSNRIVNEEMPMIYEKHFTHDEIKDLIKFYESPTGKKLLEKTPEISKDMMNAMISKYMPEFQERIKNKMEELK